MPEVTPVKALYTPHFQFRSVGWLRAALLYWEGMLRFVPDGVTALDPPEVHELVAAGLIENVSPERYRKEAAEVFTARLDDVLRTPLVPSWRQASFEPLVHTSQIDGALLEMLQRRGLAAWGGEWVRMSPELSTLYKVILANTAGAALNAAPTTDDPAPTPSLFQYRKRALGQARAAPADGFACARPFLPFPSIEASHTFNAANILRVRASFSEQRRRFREVVQARAQDIVQLPSEEAIGSHLGDFESEMNDEVSAQRSALFASTLRDTGRFLLIGAPASIGAVIALAESVPFIGVIGVVGSLGLGLTDVLMHTAQRKRAGNYLLVLEASLGTRRLPFVPRDAQAPSGGKTAARPSKS